MTTIAGPPGQDEEEIAGSEEEEETEYETEEGDSSPEELSDGAPAPAPAKPNMSRNLFNDSDSSEEESVSSLLFPPRPTSTFKEKFLSPKVSSMVCETCSLETEYSRDMGIEEEEKFEVSKLSNCPHPSSLLSSSAMPVC